MFRSKDGQLGRCRFEFGGKDLAYMDLKII